MRSDAQWLLEPFRLDPMNACLWRGGQIIALRPKIFAVLAYIVQHAGQLVTKEALFEAVWPETAVSDTVLKSCIREIRKTLGDTADAPRFIATVHRRGYRFIAPVLADESPAMAHVEPASPPSAAHSPLSGVSSAGGRTVGQSALILETKAAFQHALDVARRQGAKTLELRAAASLSRLGQHRWKSAEARHVLA